MTGVAAGKRVLIMAGGTGGHVFPALAVAEATGEPVARVVFVFLTPDGAVEHELADLEGAVDEVRSVLAGA